MVFTTKEHALDVFLKEEHFPTVGYVQKCTGNIQAGGQTGTAEGYPSCCCCWWWYAHASPFKSLPKIQMASMTWTLREHRSDLRHKASVHHVHPGVSVNPRIERQNVQCSARNYWKYQHHQIYPLQSQ